jgi:hypothetical protein
MINIRGFEGAMPQHLADEAEELSGHCDDCSAGAPAANMMFVFSLPEIWP